MPRWNTTTKHEPNSINNGNRYEKKDRLSLENLNAITENAFYAVDKADEALEKAESAFQGNGTIITLNGQSQASMEVDSTPQESGTDRLITSAGVANALKNFTPGESYDDTELRGLIAGKVDKVAGKGLSTNDYTDEEKTKLAGLENYDDSEVRGLIAGKVDAVEGKGLSTNDFTDEYVQKINTNTSSIDTALNGLSKTARRDASNLSSEDIYSWKDALGIVSSGSTGVSVKVMESSLGSEYNFYNICTKINNAWATGGILKLIIENKGSTGFSTACYNISLDETGHTATEGAMTVFNPNSAFIFYPNYNGTGTTKYFTCNTYDTIKELQVSASSMSVRQQTINGKLTTLGFKISKNTVGFIYDSNLYDMLQNYSIRLYYLE